VPRYSWNTAGVKLRNSWNTAGVKLNCFFLSTCSWVICDKKKIYEVCQLTLLIIFMQWRVLTTGLSFTLMLFNSGEMYTMTRKDCQSELSTSQIL